MRGAWSTCNKIQKPRQAFHYRSFDRSWLATQRESRIWDGWLRETFLYPAIGVAVMTVDHPRDAMAQRFRINIIANDHFIFKIFQWYSSTVEVSRPTWEKKRSKVSDCKQNKKNWTCINYLLVFLLHSLLDWRLWSTPPQAMQVWGDDTVDATWVYSWSRSMTWWVDISATGSFDTRSIASWLFGKWAIFWGFKTHE